MITDKKQEQGASDATQKDEATTETEQKVPALPAPATGDSNAEIPLDVHLLDFVRAPAPSAVKIEASPFDFPMTPFDKNSTQEALWAPEPITASVPDSNN